MLGDERFQHMHLHRLRRRAVGRILVGADVEVLDGRGLFHVRGKIRPVAEVASAAHHGQVHAGLAALHLHGQDVHVLVRPGLHRLLVQDFGQRAHLVAQLGRLFELQPLGMLHHPRLEPLQHRLGLPVQESLGVVHVLPVVLRRDQVHARRRAALDLVQQARPGAIGEHGVLAGAQPEYLLQQLDRLLDRPGAGIGAEVAVPAVDRPPVIGHPGKGGGRGRVRLVDSHLVGARDLQVGVALVVAKQDVVARVERLDQVVFQQQRFGFRSHHRGFQARDLADHVADARSAVVLLEVAGDPLLQVAGLPDVQHAAVRVEVAVDARQRGQCGDLRQQLIGMNLGHGAAIVDNDLERSRQSLRQRLALRSKVMSEPQSSINLNRHALGHLLQGHRQSRRHRRVLAPLRPVGRPRRSGAPLDRRRLGAGMDGPGRRSAHPGAALERPVERDTG